MSYSVYEVNSNTACSPGQPKVETTVVSLLFDRRGKRKYLTVCERNAFLAAARRMGPEILTFCMTLAYTGGRISEVLALTPGRIDAAARMIVFESLKKRKRGVYRAVPIPQELAGALISTHDLRKTDERIWKWCRTTGWSRVKECMTQAGVCGAPASPKGLRHTLGVSALQSGVPINLVKNWLGHSRLTTTEVYTNAVGSEEQAIAAKFWQTFDVNQIAK